jgi:hypothetical protein
LNGVFIFGFEISKVVQELGQKFWVKWFMCIGWAIDGIQSGVKRKKLLVATFNDNTKHSNDLF